MKTIWNGFIQMLKFVSHDMMQITALISVFICGSVFRFGVPALEMYLTGRFSRTSILRPYYGLFDISFSLVAPTMFCFVASMVMLEERDDNSAIYLAVTPLKKEGYIISRLVIPMVISFVMTVLLLPFFKLTELSLAAVIMLSLAGAVQALIITLIVIVFSANKLEGLAVTKLSTILTLAIFAPYFIGKRAQRLLYILPSYWIGKSVHEGSLLFLVAAIAVAAVWIGVLIRKYEQKRF